MFEANLHQFVVYAETKSCRGLLNVVFVICCASKEHYALYACTNMYMLCLGQPPLKNAHFKRNGSLRLRMAAHERHRPRAPV